MKKIFEKFQKAILIHEKKALTLLERTEKGIHICLMYLAKMKTEVNLNGFEHPKAEIAFFKRSNQRSMLS